MIISAFSKHVALTYYISSFHQETDSLLIFFDLDFKLAVRPPEVVVFQQQNAPI